MGIECSACALAFKPGKLSRYVFIRSTGSVVVRPCAQEHAMQHHSECCLQHNISISKTLLSILEVSPMQHTHSTHDGSLCCKEGVRSSVYDTLLSVFNEDMRRTKSMSSSNLSPPLTAAKQKPLIRAIYCMKHPASHTNERTFCTLAP